MARKENNNKVETKSSAFEPLSDHGITVHTNTLKRWYQLIHLGRVLDMKAANYVRQAKGWSYHSSCAGHEGIQLILGLSFRQGKDFLFPYYRDLVTCVAAGLTIEEILANGLSKAICITALQSSTRPIPTSTTASQSATIPRSIPVR